MYKCSVIISKNSSNEKKYLGILAKQIEKFLLPICSDFEIIIVENSKNYIFFEKLINISLIHKNIKVILQESNFDLGSSIWEGLKHVRFQNIIIINADLVHNVLEIEKILKTLYLRSYKLAWISRATSVKFSKSNFRNILNYVILKALNHFFKKSLDLHLTDLSNNFFGFKKSLLSKKDFSHCFIEKKIDFSFLFLYLLKLDGLIIKKNIKQIKSYHNNFYNFKLRITLNNFYLLIKSILIFSATVCINFLKIK